MFMNNSAFNSKARGVAILIIKKVHFTVSKTLKDKNDTFLIFTGIHTCFIT